ncbi:MAG: Subunit of heteropentameric Replication factor C (RF-C) [Marteilia pararefringens]
MRKAVNILQNVSHILKIQSTDGSPIDINDFIGILPDKVKKQCIDAVFKPKYDPEQFIDEYIKSGYSFETILRCLIDEIVYIQTYNVSENVKIKSLRLIAEYEYKVTTGADSELALKSLILSLRNLNE